MLFSQHWWTCLTQLFFSTKFQRWNNVGSSTLNRRNSINVVSTLFCQRWNNVDKCTSTQHSFSTKYQRWCVFWELLYTKKSLLLCKVVRLTSNQLSAERCSNVIVLLCTAKTQRVQTMMGRLVPTITSVIL